MCGICGVIQLGGEPRQVVTSDRLALMTSVLEHRGPDDQGFYEAPGVAIGARRLSIVDVAGGHQPFANEDGTVWAAQNGELYNHKEIRRGLERDGHRFRSRCDTEILPHLYERDGVRLVDALRGMFGIVVWDGQRRRAVLARDRMGIKPLYYAVSGGALVFGSELKSVLASGLVPIEIDVESIHAYLTLGYVPGPSSPIAGVKKLMPGERLVVDGGLVQTERYWRYPEPAPAERHRSADDWSEELIARLDESVRLRLMADVPLGAMLSGGLDSSLIVALMARNMDEPVNTFSIGFADAGDTNELGDAERVARTFGTNHHQIELSLADQVVDLAELTWHMDEPVADLSALGFLPLSELAARHVTVALSGQGADELFGGYLKHRAAAICNYWDRFPAAVKHVGARLAPHARGRLERAAQTLTAPDPAQRLIMMSGKFDADLRRRLARGRLLAVDGDPALEAVRRTLGETKATALGTTLFLDAQLGLVDDMLHYFDRASMAHSLEVRVPFIDHEFVEFAATIPDAVKMRRFEPKALLKHAARGLVPDDIIRKPKLGFFRDSVGSWFRAQTRGAVGDYLLASSPHYADLIDRAEVERLVGAHADGHADSRDQHLLLAILMLEIWLATFLPRARALAATEPTARLSA